MEIKEIYHGGYFKQSCTYQFINNFIKNEHYTRSASRVLPSFYEYKLKF